MYDQTICDPTPNATSSPASECGATPCAALGGLTIAQFGQALAPANLSARQAKALGLMMSGTCGPHGSNSSSSDDPPASMVSRLRAKTASHGSTLFELTWKRRNTPGGHSIYALRASARRTSDNDCSSWPTPTAGEAGGTPEQFLARKAKLQGSCGVSLTALNLVAQLAAWVTPSARDWKDTPGMSTSREDGRARLDQLPRQATLAGWPTPTAALQGSPETPEARKAQGFNPGLTPMDAAGLVGPVRLTTSGELLTGSDAATASGGQLNPAHPRWLMGLPPVWDECAVTAMQSSRRLRKRSSNRPSEK